MPDTDVRFWKRAAIALAIACAFLLLVLASGAAAKSERPKAAHQAGMIHYMIHA